MPTLSHLGVKVSDRWRYDDRTHRYHDARTNRFLAPSRETNLAASILAKHERAMAAATRALTEHRLSVQDWDLAMRQQLQDTHTLQYMLGRGGRNAMTMDDRRVLTEIVNEQWRYLDQFTRSISAGDLSAAQVQARAKMYGAAGRISHEMGQAGTYVGLRLPAMPGVGTACRVNCKCSWRIEETPTEYRAWWRIHASESCATCTGRAAEYSPYQQIRFSLAGVA